MRPIVVLTCLFAFAGLIAPATADDTSQVFFERDIRPILKTHCFQCHGDEPELSGGLDLRLSRLIQTGGDSGPAIIAGDAAASLMVQRITNHEMPPKGSGPTEAELALLTTWISQGALTLRAEPDDPSQIGPWTEEELGFWSFQPVVRPEVPTVTQSQQVANPIDAFLLAKLEEKGLSFSPAASKETLLRRLCLDLTGLPPTQEQLDRFLADEQPDAYARMVEELLASPHYGERWGRHWLDAVGYADSDGYVADDPARPWAWLYRDYVIRSFNADKPFNQFIVEQLAGDELIEPPLEDLTPEEVELLTATGFLRMAPDGTGAGPDDVALARNDVIAETIKAVTTNLLGLTVGCAQCHNHRYDPISQADYYRLRAIFEPAFDTQNWRTPDQRLVNLWDSNERAQSSGVDTKLAEIEAQHNAELDAAVLSIFDNEVNELPEDLRELARAARDTPEAERTPEQLQVMKDHPSLNVDRGSAYLYDQARIDEINKRFEQQKTAAEQERPAKEFVSCTAEVAGQVPVTHLFYRGDITQPREEVTPSELSVLDSLGAVIPADDEAVPTTGRRLAWARHLTSGRHPLVARVMVNRVWMHHFARGIVATPGDFGALGERPSHPELLDWLADEFVTSGWSMKQLHRLIVLSNAYQQSSTRTQQLNDADPDNVLLGRMPVRRLETEAIRDSMLAVSGSLNSEMFGPPLEVTKNEVGLFVLGSGERDGNGILIGDESALGDARFRRSIYIQVRRTMPVSALEPFDLPEMTPNCPERDSSTGAGQSLMMLNGPFVIEQSKRFADRVATEAGDDAEARVRQAWRLAFGQDPSDEEVIDALSFLIAQQQHLQSTPSAPGEGETPPDTARLALASFCQALFASNRFLYVE
jgi:hypothetical protein